MLRFFKDYLLNRAVRTRYAGLVSSPRPIVNGVTQGSPLAGTLFLLFENDFFYLPLKAASTGFADDINLITAHRSANIALSNMAADMPVIFRWYRENRLLINIRKTKLMIFSNSNEPPLIPPELRKIEQVNEIKILGLVINSKLNYSDHTRMILSKLSTANAMLLKLKLSGFPKKVLLSVYQALFVPHLLYCTSIWGYAPRALLQPMQVQQNKAIRIIFGMSPRDSTLAIMRENHLPRLAQHITMSMAKFIFGQVMVNGCHPFLHKLLLGSSPSSSSTMPTRAQVARAIYVPAFNTEHRRRTVFIKGVVEFNALPISVRCPSSLASFRARVKKFVLSRAD
jgi:hypothetical protein